MVFGIQIFAQSDLQKADKAFRLLKYQEAIDFYTKVLINDDNPYTRERLVEAYFLTGDYPAAELTIRPLVDQTTNGKIVLRYANLLLLNNKKDMAKKILNSYIEKYPVTEEYERLSKSIQIGLQIDSTENYLYTINKAPFNSEVSDYSPVYYKDKIIYTSQKGGKLDAWTGRSYSNIYITSPDRSESSLLEGNLNGIFHNGAVTFLDDETMIFTRNNRKRASNESYNLILAMAKKDGNAWNFTRELMLNDRKYSNAYPTYLKAHQMLIFSSDREGGFGGMDLYYSKLINGKWSHPVNMGNNVNTSGDEVFAFTDDNDLYFASNGRPGMGGLDIYKVGVGNNFNGKITILSTPINSYRDDFGFIIKSGTSKGYFVSNRAGTGSVDNIYSFIKEDKPTSVPSIVLSGIVIDEYTRMPLKDTEISLTSPDEINYNSVTTGEDGRFSFEVSSGQNYRVSGQKNGIATSDTLIKSTDTPEDYYITLIHSDPRFSLEGYAIDNKTQNGVEGVKVMCFNTKSRDEADEVTNEDGFFKFQLVQDADFEISGTKGGFYTSISEASTKGLNRSKTLYVKLFLTVEEVIIGDSKILGKETFGGFEFRPVYYDLNKHNIRPDASIALDKVVDFLNKNPELLVELGSHTDSRASTEYNQKLSFLRAQSAVDYIVSKGIDSERITARGYGESQLVNECHDGVTCNEHDHQANRRTEIKIIALDED